jgi:hypothetical protein
MGTIKVKEEELIRIRNDIMKASEKAIHNEDVIVGRLNDLLTIATEEVISIVEYGEMASEISFILNLFIDKEKGTIFYYPYKNIKLDIYGKPSTFKKECKSLLNQLDELNKYIENKK